MEYHTIFNITAISDHLHTNSAQYNIKKVIEAAS